MRGAGPHHTLLHVRVLETGDQRARTPLLVAEEEVPDPGVVLARALLERPHAQQVPVKVDRAAGVLAEHGYVVDAGDLKPAHVQLLGASEGPGPAMTKNQIEKAITAIATLTVITASSAVAPCVSRPRASRSSRCLRLSQPSTGTIAMMLTTTPTIITPSAVPTEPVDPWIWEPM